MDNEALTNFQSCQIYAAHVDFSGVAGKNPIFIRLPNIFDNIVRFCGLLKPLPCQISDGFFADICLNNLNCLQNFCKMS